VDFKLHHYRIVGVKGDISPMTAARLPLGGAGCGFGSAGWLVHWDSAVFVDGEPAEGLVQFAAFADVGNVLF